MPNQLHHVVMLSHSATRFIGFLTDVVGMEVQHSFRVPGEILETTLGWPPSAGADVTILGSGHVLDRDLRVRYNGARCVANRARHRRSGHLGVGARGRQQDECQPQECEKANSDLFRISLTDHGIPP